MIKKIKIYDLDGTLLDSSHRYRAVGGKIDLAHWRENDTPAMVMKDGFLDLYEWVQWYGMTICQSASNIFHFRLPDFYQVE